jgi:tRNA threonylcarbamoyladenosine biosynthesis protein TsaE
MDINISLAAIDKAAAQFLSLIKNSRTIAFHGEMGAGKTTFIHALCEVLDVKDAVGSPTFSIINQYQTAGNETVYHIDLYRLKDEEEAIQTGVEDCLYSGNYCFVEWPEKAAGLFPENTLHVYIVPVDNDSRKLTINL